MIILKATVSRNREIFPKKKGHYWFYMTNAEANLIQERKHEEDHTVLINSSHVT